MHLRAGIRPLCRTPGSIARLPRLPPDRAHRPRRLAEAGLGDVVLQLLAPDGFADDVFQLVVAGAGAQRALQIGLVQAEEASAQAAVGGQADPVAVAAERLRDRVDEADLAAAVGEAVDARGGVPAATERLERADA